MLKSKTTLEKTLSDAISKAVSELKDLQVIEKAAQGSPDNFALHDNGKIVLTSLGKPVIKEYGLPPNWKSSAWRLERKNPERWGK